MGADQQLGFVSLSAQLNRYLQTARKRTARAGG